jgi:hypothetical protein
MDDRMTDAQRRTGRPKGSGVISTIDAAKQDPVEIRERLHVGGEPVRVRDEHARLLIAWRDLIAQRDDCVKRLGAGEGTKQTRKRLTRLRCEIADKWRQLGDALGAMNDAELSDKLAVLSEATRPERPSVFAWQEEATRQIELVCLVGANRNSLAAEVRSGRLLEGNWPNSKVLPLAGRIKADSEDAARQLLNRLRKQGHTVSLDKDGVIVHGKVNITAQRLFAHLKEECGFTMTIDDVRRFVRDRLRVTMRNERGKRTDLSS